MQSMVELKRNGKNVNVFFDVDWDSKAVQNVSVRDGKETLRLTALDAEMVLALVEQEVIDIIMQATLDKADGRVVLA